MESADRRVAYHSELCRQRGHDHMATDLRSESARLLAEAWSLSLSDRSGASDSSTAGVADIRSGDGMGSPRDVCCSFNRTLATCGLYSAVTAMRPRAEVRKSAVTASNRCIAARQPSKGGFSLGLSDTCPSRRHAFAAQLPEGRCWINLWGGNRGGGARIEERSRGTISTMRKGRPQCQQTNTCA